MMSMLPHGREDRVRKECHRRLPVELFEDRRVRPGLDEGTLAHGGALHDLADPCSAAATATRSPIAVTAVVVARRPLRALESGREPVMGSGRSASSEPHLLGSRLHGSVGSILGGTV